MIREARKGLDRTQVSVATELGWSDARLSSYENGTRHPGEEELRLLGKALRTDFFLQLSEAKGDNFALTAKEKRRIPLLNFSQLRSVRDVSDLSGLHGLSVVEVDAGNSSPSCFAVTLEGDSMVNPSGSPSFPAGTVIVVDPNLPHAPDRYVIAKDPQTGTRTFKKLTTDAGRWYLRPLNPSYPTIEITSPADSVEGIAVEWQIRGLL